MTRFKVKRESKRTDRQIAIDFADLWFSRYIRSRDSDDNGYAFCITCSSMHAVPDMDCGHFAGRGHMGTRYVETNAHAQCKKCNKYKGGEPAEHYLRIVEKYGKTEAESVLARSRAPDFSTAQTIREAGDYYKLKANQIAGAKGIKWW